MIWIKVAGRGIRYPQGGFRIRTDRMPRLFMLLLSISVGTLAGIGVIVALVMGHYDWRAILIAAGIGAVVAVPATWMIARRIQDTDPTDSLD